MDELMRTEYYSTDQNPIMCSFVDHESIALVKKFSHLCERIEHSIAQQKVIQERALLDFSRMSVNIVQSRVVIDTSAFHNLSRHISDYWHYELKHETNPKRGYSYVRLYQMLTMLQTFHVDCELEYRVHDALETNRNNADLIAQIRHFPGITHKKLRESLETTSVDWKNRLRSLEDEGYVAGHRSGEERYYVLTNAGDVLYCHLSKKGQNHWVDQWSEERIGVLHFILLLIKQCGNKSITVLDVERQMAALDEKTIKLLFKYINTNGAIRKLPLGYPFQTEKPDIYIEERVMEKSSNSELLEKVSRFKWDNELPIYAKS